ncbi:MAG: hypothetical protein AB1553_00535 [Nitrospirota bacterium]
MPKWIAIMRTGTFTDSEGKEHNFTEKDLDAIVAKYNPKFHEAPEVIGHPKSNSPAYGWVKALKREGDTLFYEPRDRVAEFQEMLDKKMFKKRSVRLNSKIGLVHVGWLGAMPPAIKGLPDVAFNDDEDGITFEFAEYRFPMIGRMFQKVREFIIEKFGTETADKIIPSWEIEDLQRMEPETVSSAAFSEPSTKGGEMPTEREKQLEEQLAEERRKSADFSEQLKAANQRAAALEAENRRRDFSSFCEGLTKEGKLPPAVVPVVLDFMEILSGVETFDFAEGEGKKAAKPVDVFKTFLGGLGKVIEFGEYATKTKTGDAGNKDREELISDFMAKNKDASYKEAVLAVSKEHPELFKEEV